MHACRAVWSNGCKHMYVPMYATMYAFLHAQRVPCRANARTPANDRIPHLAAKMHLGERLPARRCREIPASHLYAYTHSRPGCFHTLFASASKFTAACLCVVQYGASNERNVRLIALQDCLFSCLALFAGFGERHTADFCSQVKTP